MNRIFVALVSFALIGAASSTARAEIVKQAIVDCAKKGICFYWWPKLPTLPGWHTDQSANFANGGNGINTLVPDGYNFSNAEAIMYANADYKARYIIKHPNTTTLDGYIENDKTGFAPVSKDLSITEVKPLLNGDGKTLRSFTFFRPNEKNWEQVTYYEEGDYYITFVLNSNSESGFRANLPAYEALVKAYKQ